MANTEKLTKLKTILESTGVDTIKRSEFIAAAKDTGLVEKDTYVVLREWCKHSTRGHYIVAAMLREIETKVTGKILTKPVKRKEREESTDEDSKVLAYGEIPYSDNDVAEELAIMGTTI
jgi:hypothetical protein